MKHQDKQTDGTAQLSVRVMVFVIILVALAAGVQAHDGDPSKIHACVRASNGDVVVVQADDDCSGLNPPDAWFPVHWQIESGDEDWTGAGTGNLRPFSLSDSVAVGAEGALAQFYVRTDEESDGAALRVDPRGVQGLLVDSQGQVLIGTPGGALARLTVNAFELEDAFRARVNGVTHFAIKADGQTGIGTSEPGARLEVRSRPGEDAVRIRRPGLESVFFIDEAGNVGLGLDEAAPLPDQLSVLQEGLGRAGFFNIENPANQTAALSAVTTGRGSALFANILNATSSAPALFVRHSGPGPAARFDRGDVHVMHGRLGVGTDNPDGRLTIRDQGHQLAIVDSNNNDKTWTITSHQGTSGVGFWENGNNGRLVVTAGGRVGIGTTNPEHELVVQGNNPIMQIRDDTSDNSARAARLELLERAGGDFDGGAFFRWNGSTNRLLIGTKLNGEDTNVLVIDRATHGVGIGTQNPGNFRLAVDGAIRAKEVVVETGWSDFVFEPDYKLPSLEELEAHVVDRRHLPGVPTAREVAENGVQMGRMQSLLLAKIEELTLYVIAMNKRIKSVEGENVGLRQALVNSKGTGAEAPAKAVP